MSRLPLRLERLQVLFGQPLRRIGVGVIPVVRRRPIVVCHRRKRRRARPDPHRPCAAPALAPAPVLGVGVGVDVGRVCRPAVAVGALDYRCIFEYKPWEM